MKANYSCLSSFLFLYCRFIAIATRYSCAHFQFSWNEIFSLNGASLLVMLSFFYVYTASTDYFSPHLASWGCEIQAPIIYFSTFDCSLNLSWILLNIFINTNSLVTHGHCIFRSWNIAANDNHLWEMQYVALFGGRAKLVEGKNNRLLLEPIDTRIITDWKEAVKGAYTGKLNVEEM